MSTVAPSHRTAVPRPVRAAFGQRQERLAVQLAVRSGVRDPLALTNMVFRARHPRRALLPPADPGLLDEWERIRDEIVRPVLAVGAVHVATTLPRGAHHGASGPVSTGVAVLERILGRDNVTNDYAVRGHVEPTWHAPATASPMSHAVDFLPKRTLWDRLFPIRGKLHELYGPWGLYRDGRRFENDALQRRHEHHIHVAYLGSGEEIARLLGGAPAQRSDSVRQVPAPGAPGRFFKDSPELRRASLAPPAVIPINRSWPQRQRLLASTYNRIGGLIGELARSTSIDPAAALAVWMTETAGRAHVAGKAVIRFENHLLYRLWGRTHDDLYARHFRHGGYRGTPGRSWEAHMFREAAGASWQPFHGHQDREYRVLDLARRLAGDEVALQCTSIGGPQILMSNYRALGYASPRAMFDAWQADERAQVLGFFDLCAHSPAPHPGDLLAYLRDRRFGDFARYYNGPGQVQVYATLIRERYDEARRLPVGR